MWNYNNWEEVFFVFLDRHNAFARQFMYVYSYLVTKAYRSFSTQRKPTKICSCITFSILNNIEGNHIKNWIHHQKINNKTLTKTRVFLLDILKGHYQRKGKTLIGHKIVWVIVYNKFIVLEFFLLHKMFL